MKTHYPSMLFDSKSFIVDKDGAVKSVILDYKEYQKLEEILLDEGLAQAMRETADDEEVDLDEARRIIGKR
jgi:hypothetical protein